MDTAADHHDEDATRRLLKERSRVLARRNGASTAGADMLQLLTFSLGKEGFGIEVGHVQEVHPLRRQMWSRVPCSPAFIVGVVTIRGNIYSMMHLGRFLGIEASPVPENAHLLLVKSTHNGGGESIECCLVSDDIPRIEWVAPGSIRPASETVSPRSEKYIRGVTKDMRSIVNLERLLGDPAVIVDEAG